MRYPLTWRHSRSDPMTSWRSPQILCKSADLALMFSIQRLVGGRLCHHGIVHCSDSERMNFSRGLRLTGTIALCLT